MRFCLIVLVGVLLTGCVQGDTSPLPRVIESSRQRFVGRVQTVPDNVLRKRMDELDQKISVFVERCADGDCEAGAKELDGVLRELGQQSGYPVRPSMRAVAEQYFAIDVRPPLEKEAVQLLAARTYDVVNAELEGAQFGTR